MAKVLTIGLNANYICWFAGGELRTRNLNLAIVHELPISLFGIAPIPNLANLNPMPVGGNIVGIMVNIDDNDDPNDEEVVFVKGQAGPTFTEYSMKVTIPALETGTFFSDPTIPEFNRTFVKGDFIGIRMKKTVPSALGMEEVTIALALEIEFPPS